VLRLAQVISPAHLRFHSQTECTRPLPFYPKLVLNLLHTDPRETKGRVNLGAKTVSEHSVQDRYMADIAVVRVQTATPHWASGKQSAHSCYPEYRGQASNPDLRVSSHGANNFTTESPQSSASKSQSGFLAITKYPH